MKGIPKWQLQEDLEEHLIMSKQIESMRNEDPDKKLARQRNYEEAMNEIAEGHAQYEREEVDPEWESMKSAGKREKERITSDVIMMLGEVEKENGIQAVEEVWDWIEIEAAVDTACVDNVVNPKHFPGIQLHETEESKRGDAWTAAGGSSIPKLGEMRIPWQSATGAKHGLRAKAGNVGKTFISGDRLLEAGYAIILNRRNPRLVHETTKEVIKLERKNRMFMMKMWVRVKVKGVASKDGPASSFTRQGPE